MFSDGTIWPKGKTIRYNITKNIAIQYGMHKCNIKLNALQHGRQFVKERLLLWQRMRAWSVQQDDYRSETADMGTCSDDLKRGRLIGNVDRRQRDVGTGDNGDAAMVDRQVVS